MPCIATAMSPPDAAIEPFSASHCTATAIGSSAMTLTGTSMPIDSGAFIRADGNV